MANLLPVPPPGPQRRLAFGAVSKSTIFPLLGDHAGLVGKAHLIPVVATIATGLAIFLSANYQFVDLFTPRALTAIINQWSAATAPTIKDPKAAEAFAQAVNDALQQGNLQALARQLNDALQVCWIIGGYVTLMVNYFVYRLCGRDKPWWLLAGTFALMAVALDPGPLGPLLGAYNHNMTAAFGPVLGMFAGPGLGEEVGKALPVFALAVFGMAWSNALGRRIGVTEPLDGILIGVASATGFAMVETMYQYLPNLMVALLKQFGPDAAGVAQFVAVKLMLTRTLPELGGHLAYSGIFGYFIGLAALKRSSVTQILLVGLLSAAALHGAWDAVPFSLVTHSLLAVVSYAFLASCILKGRKISPTRVQNFASTDLASLQKMQTVYQPPKDETKPQHMIAKATSPAGVKLLMRLGPVSLKLVPGLAIEPMNLGSAGQGRGKNPIAEIAANPNDRNVLGLRNVSNQTYRATLTGGRTVDLPTGKAVQLAPGLIIDFGGITGSVEIDPTAI